MPKATCNLSNESLVNDSLENIKIDPIIEQKNKEIEGLKKLLEEERKTRESFVKQTEKIETFTTNNNDNVVFTSLCDGILTLFDGHINLPAFEFYGAKQIYPLHKAKEILNYNSSFLKSGYFTIDKHELLNQYIDINGAKNILNDSMMNTILNYTKNINNENIESILSSAPEAQKEMICDLIVRQVAKDEDLFNFDRLRLIDKICKNKGEKTIIERAKQSQNNNEIDED